MNSHYWMIFLIVAAIKCLPLSALTWATPIFELNSDEPQIAISENGNVIVIVRKKYEPNHMIEATTYKHSTNCWSDPIFLSELDKDVSQQRLAVDPVGNAIVVWQANDGVYYKIQTAIYSVSSGTWMNVKDLSGKEKNSVLTHAAMDEFGNAFAAWKIPNEKDDTFTTTTFSETSKTWSKPMSKRIPKENPDEYICLYDAVNNATVIIDKTHAESYVIYRNVE